MNSALLLSGGMDSLSLAWWRRPQSAITIDYGQIAASAEVAASARICEELGIEHHIVRVDCRALGSGDMAGDDPDALAPSSDWWPYRNQLIVTLAAMNAIPRGVSVLLLGTVKSDCSHRDGTEEFVRTLSTTLQLQEGGMSLEAPAIGMTTLQLIRSSAVPMSLLAWAHSCHKSDVACGVCRGCTKYFEVLHELENGLD